MRLGGGGGIGKTAVCYYRNNKKKGQGRKVHVGPAVALTSLFLRCFFFTGRDAALDHMLAQFKAWVRDTKQPPNGNPPVIVGQQRRLAVPLPATLGFVLRAVVHENAHAHENERKNEHAHNPQECAQPQAQRAHTGTRILRPPIGPRKPAIFWLSVGIETFQDWACWSGVVLFCFVFLATLDVPVVA